MTCRLTSRSQRLIAGTYQTLNFTFSTPVISPWTRLRMRSPRWCETLSDLYVKGFRNRWLSEAVYEHTGIETKRNATHEQSFDALPRSVAAPMGCVTGRRRRDSFTRLDAEDCRRLQTQAVLSHRRWRKSSESDANASRTLFSSDRQVFVVSRAMEDTTAKI